MDRGLNRPRVRWAVHLGFRLGLASMMAVILPPGVAAQSPPGAFSRTAPANGATALSTSPTLSWTTSTGATNYEYCYDTTNDALCNTAWISNGTATSVALSGLGVGTPYYWHVRAVGGGVTYANGSATGFWTFTTAAPTAELTIPAGTLTSSTQAFAWTSGSGVTAYWLTVGTTGAGSLDLVDRNMAMLQSTVVTDLPTDGRRLYVRLYSRLGASTWLYRDYEFDSYTAFAPAFLISPAPGERLSSTRQTFAWSDGIGVLGYQLAVGTTPGSSEILMRSFGSGERSVVIRGLPTDGRRLYVSLWSAIQANLIPRWYQFDTVLADGRAWLTAPAADVRLSATLQTFAWEGSAPGTQHWLQVGTSGAGSTNVVNRSVGTGPSTVVTGLPADGRRIFARLWSNVVGLWWFRDFRFESLRADGPAWLTAPAPDASLASTRQTFAWAPGTGVTQYWLHIGSTGVGSFDLVNRDPGSGPSTLVEGLPTDGRLLYVRLWSNVGGSWGFRDYENTSLTDDGPGWLTTPVPGQTLAGASQTFTWTPGTGVTMYWLHVGTTGVGSFDLVNRNPGLGPSTLVTGLPTDGRRLYVRLWSLVGATWRYRDYELMSAG